MSAADPRPPYKVHRLFCDGQFLHEGTFELKVSAHRNTDGTASRFAARVHLDCRSGALEIDLPCITPESARLLAERLVTAATECEAIDQWHLRNPQPIEAAA